MKKMNSTLHGILDYATVAMWETVPSLLKLSSPHVAFMRAFGGAFLGVNLATKYPLAIKKVIPFPIHGALEAGSAVMFLGMSINPLLKKPERLFYLASGIQLGTMVLLSNYEDKNLSIETPAFEDAPESKKSDAQGAENEGEENTGEEDQGVESEGEETQTEENTDQTSNPAPYVPPLETLHDQQIREEQEAVQGVKQVMETMSGESKITDDETDEGMPYRSTSSTQNFAP